MKQEEEEEDEVTEARSENKQEEEARSERSKNKMTQEEEEEKGKKNKRKQEEIRLVSVFLRLVFLLLLRWFPICIDISLRKCPPHNFRLLNNDTATEVLFF